MCIVRARFVPLVYNAWCAENARNTAHLPRAAHDRARERRRLVQRVVSAFRQRPIPAPKISADGCGTFTETLKHVKHKRACALTDVHARVHTPRIKEAVIVI